MIHSRESSSSLSAVHTAFLAATVLFLAVLCLDPAHAEVFGALAAVLGGATLYIRREINVLWTDPLLWLTLGFGFFSSVVILVQDGNASSTGIIYGWIIPLIIGKTLAHLRSADLHRDLLLGAATLAGLMILFFVLPWLGLPQLGSIHFGTENLTYTFHDQTRTAMFISLAALIAVTHIGPPVRYGALALTSCAVLLPAMILAGKRMTLAAFVASVALFFVLRHRLRWRGLAMAGLILVALGGIIALLDDTQRFDLRPSQLFASQGVQERTTVWYAAREMFTSAPLVGTGFRSFRDAAAPFVAEYRATHPGIHNYENLNDAHNVVLHLLAESGLVGLALFTAIFVVPLRRLWRIRQVHPAARCLGACLVLILLNFQLHMHLLAYNVSALIFFFLGLAQGIRQTKELRPC